MSIRRTIRTTVPNGGKRRDGKKIDASGREVKANEEQSVSREKPVTGLERWREWKRMLDRGLYSSQAELARGEGVSRAAVTKGLRQLEQAAPEI